MTEDSSGDGGRTDGRADAASSAEVDQLAAEYRDAGRPFARLTVVRREPPVSANVGDRAIVTSDGELTGWIGGAACAQSIAVKEATAALERNEPVLVGLAPDPDDVARPGLEAYPMTCHSGGTLELFVEPVTSRPRLVVVGESPIARALGRLAGETSFEVTVLTGPDTDPADHPSADEVVAVTDAEQAAVAVDDATAVVVASMGEYDVAGLDVAFRSDASYVGLVASDARRDEVAAEVGDRLDVDSEVVVDGVTTPAGLDVGAKTPEEIAVSILAELIAVRRDVTDAAAIDVADATTVEVGEPPGPSIDDADDHDAHDGHAHDEHAHDTAEETAAADETATADEEVAVDPVCGMDVVVGEAAATVTHEGVTYHFCADGCAEAFADDPDHYVDTGAIAGG